MSYVMRHASSRGLTLIEMIVGIALVAVLIVVFGVSLTAAVYAQRIKHRNLATALGDQVLAALATYDPSTIPNQAGGAVLGVLFPQGAFGSQTDATAPSGGRVLEAATGTGTGLTAVHPLPKNAYADYALSASMKAVPAAPAGWRMGFLFRAADLQNGYRVYLTANSLVLEKIVNGAVTTLYSDVRSIPAGSWQALGVTTNSSSISVLLNGLTVTTQNDGTFSSGKAALAAWEGAAVRFDDVAIDGSSWNFDALSDGALPDDWLRFGLSNLPNGAATMTVTTPYGDASLKQVDVTVSWSDKSSGTKSVTRSGYVR